MSNPRQFPTCPSVGLAAELMVSRNILNNPKEMRSYTERVPLMHDEDLSYVDNPSTYHNLLWYLRTEKIPHPFIFFKEVCRREPYMVGNVRLQGWVTSMIRGTYSKTHLNPEDRLVTSACSCCGSSCLGIFSGFPRCYVRLACGAFGASSKGVFILVPSIRYFRDPVMVQVVNNWNGADRAQFAISNAPITSFPYSEVTGNPGGEGKTETEEEARESEIQAVILSLDSPRRVLNYRDHLPSLEVVDLLLVYPFPEHKSQIIRRIQQLQLTMTGASELTMHLDTCNTSQLEHYYGFWRTSLLAIRCLINVGATAPLRMSDCTLDMLHGGKTSFDLALPSMRAYREEAHEWWLLWIDKSLVPQLRRISGIDCGCPHHKVSPRPREGQL